MITAQELLSAIFRRKFVIVLVFVAGIICGVACLFVIEPTYTIRMVIAPNPQSNSSDSNRASGAAALLFSSLGSKNSVDPYDLFTQTLASYRLAQLVEKRDGFLQRLYPQRWDAAHGAWRSNDGLIASIRRKIYGALGRPLSETPTVWDLRERIEKLLVITEIKKTAFREISVELADRQLGLDLLTKLHDEADELVRQDQKERTTAYLGYLESTIDTVTNSDNRKALTDLISENQRTMLLINAPQPFAAQVIDPPVASVTPTNPSLVKIILIFAGLGLVAGVFLALSIEWRGILERRETEAWSQRSAPHSSAA